MSITIDPNLEARLRERAEPRIGPIAVGGKGDDGRDDDEGGKGDHFLSAGMRTR